VRLQQRRLIRKTSVAVRGAGTYSPNLQRGPVEGREGWGLGL